MKKVLFSIFLFLLFGLMANAQTTPPSANEILQNAFAQAKNEHKKVLIIFHASWCPWCHKLDKAINDSSCKKYFDDNFVIKQLIIWERGDKAALNNPGAIDVFNKYGGMDQGIPYWLIFDDNGNFLTDSKFKKSGEKENMSNSGYPSSEAEIQVFINKLKKYTNMTDAEAIAIHDCFLKNAE